MVNSFNIDPNAVYDSLNNFGNDILDRAKMKADRLANKISTKYGAGNQYRIDPKAKTVGQIKQARQTQQAIKAGKAIDRGISALKTAGKAGAEFGAPVVGGTWDMYSGYRKIRDGNPLWGAGQMLYGAGELGLDAIGLLGSAISGGGAEAADVALSAAARKGMQTLYRNLIKQGINKNTARVLAMNSVKSELAKNAVRRTANTVGNTMRGANRVVNSLPANLVGTAFFEGGNALSNMFEGNGGTNTSASNGKDQGIDVTQTGVAQPTTTSSTGGYSGSGSYGGGTGNALIGGKTGANGNITPELLNSIAKTEQGYEGGGYRVGDPMQLYSNYMLRQQAMQPYRDELNNYIRDYKRYSDWSYNQDKHLALLAALTGAQGLNNMIGKYTAIGDEDKITALKKMQGEDYKNIGDQLAQIQGNVALARKIGLPLESVNASDNMLRLAVQDQMNDDRLENKLALAQYNATVRQRLQEERFRFQQAMRAGNRRVAQQSAMKMNEYYKALQAMGDYGVTPDDIYKSTGKRIYAPQEQIGPSIKKL